MLRHYLKISIRNISRNKVFSLINILGLAVGMGVCLLIYQYIHFELSYDQFHENSQNTYRLTQTSIRNGEDLGTSSYTTYGLGVRAKETIPEIEDFVRIHQRDDGPVVENPEINEPHQENNVWYVDSTFLQIFDFPLKYGDKASGLSGNHSVMITEETAIKYFGDKNPLGKELKFSLGVLSGDFIITGVLETLPTNTHLQFDILLPMKFLLKAHRFYRESDSEGWKLADFVTYVTLNKSANASKLGDKFDHLIQTYAGKELSGYNESWEIGLQPITDIHLESSFIRDFARNNGNIENIRFFSLIAIFILLMAWVNYINLSTAQAMQRAKEVGVRKSIGAAKKQLISQFLAESVLINITAALVSIGIALLMLPVLNQIIGKEIELSLVQDFEFMCWFTTIIIFGSLFSGLYPAFILSSFKPISVFKPFISTQKDGISLRKGLIVFQFLISALLISGTYLVYQQIIFMRNQDLGIDMEKILVVDGARVFSKTLSEEGETMGSLYQSFKNKAAIHHSIFEVSASSSVPGKGYYYTEGFRISGEPQNTNNEINLTIVDTDFTDAYDLEFLAKLSFSKDIAPDENVVINEEAVKAFGFGSAEDALNEILVNNYGDTAKVVGVIKNVYWSSLKYDQSPILFFLNNQYGAYFSIKMNPSDIPESIAHIESAYKSVFPGNPFNYFFLDDNFDRQYQSDLQFGNLFTAFSILAILIACLGLFALVSFSATLKIKEIGVRKVLGASVGNLMLLLSREYIVLLLIANILAIPVILLGARAWLDNYAFRIGIGMELFLVPALVLFIISLLTVSYRTYATANANPVKSLKTE